MRSRGEKENLNFIFRHLGRTFKNFEGLKFLVGPNLSVSHEFRCFNLEFGFDMSPIYDKTCPSKFNSHEVFAKQTIYSDRFS